MARRKKKSQRKSPAGKATAAARSAPGTPAPTSHGRLKLAAAAALVWVAALAALTLSTANQPMLNRLQIEQADLIVTAKIIDVQQGTVEVKKNWKPGREHQPITVRNLSKTNARSGSTYLLPLTSLGGNTYEITRPTLRRERDTESELHRPPRIYDATADAIVQLREILGS